MASGFWTEDGTTVYLPATVYGTIDMWWIEDGNTVTLRQANADANFPAVGDVRSGSTYGYSLEYIGNNVMAAAGSVKAGYQYGAGGTEYTGSLSASGAGPTAPVLAITNNGNGSATYSISGADNATTNTVYSQTFSGTGWTFAGSRANNGTGVFGIAAGAYWFKATSVNAYAPTDSNLVFATITDGSASYIYDLCQAIKTTIDAGGVVDTGGTTVLAQVDWPPEWDSWTSAKVYIVPDTESCEPLLSSVDELVNGVNVVFCEHQANGTSLTPQTEARRDIEKLFVGKRLTSMADTWCEGITDSKLFDAQALQNYHGVSAIALKFRTRALRST